MHTVQTHEIVVTMIVCKYDILEIFTSHVFWEKLGSSLRAEMMYTLFRRARNDYLPESQWMVMYILEHNNVQLDTTFKFLNICITNFHLNMASALPFDLVSPEYTIRNR